MEVEKFLLIYNRLLKELHFKRIYMLRFKTYLKESCGGCEVAQPVEINKIQIIDNIKKLTESNKHFEARMMGADLLQNGDLFETYKSLKCLVNVFPDVSELNGLKLEIDQRMFDVASKKLKVDEFKKFKNAF